MNSITQDINFKQSVIKYSYKHGVTAASIVYKLHRKTIYRWREKYDGTLKSLANKSRRPHRSPNAHTESEIKMIKDYKNKNKDTGLVVLWVKLRKAGYTRSVTSLYRMMIKLGIYKKTPSRKKVYEPKAYQQMQYPGQRVQVDVKYVPMKCLTKELKEQGERYFQYTAIDEYTRMRVLWFAKEHSTYESSQFIDEIIKKFPFKIVERSHRKDQERFYYKKVFCSFEDLVNRAKYWIKEYNNFPMRPLKWLSPREKYLEYISS